MSPSGGARILYERSGERVATVTLNRPEALNACTYAMWEELARLWDEIRRDDAVSVVVLTGAGRRAFCAGVDLKEIAHSGPSASPFAPAPPLLENWDRYTGASSAFSNSTSSRLQARSACASL